MIAVRLHPAPSAQKLSERMQGFRCRALAESCRTSRAGGENFKVSMQCFGWNNRFSVEEANEDNKGSRAERKRNQILCRGKSEKLLFIILVVGFSPPPSSPVLSICAPKNHQTKLFGSIFLAIPPLALIFRLQTSPSRGLLWRLKRALMSALPEVNT